MAVQRQNPAYRLAKRMTRFGGSFLFKDDFASSARFISELAANRTKNRPAAVYDARR